MRIGIVANEPSGDQLGAGLIQAIRIAEPTARFEGIGGPRMIAQGCRSLYPMETLSVMGLFEVLGHLPRILGIRKSLAHRFLSDPPDVFVGIDAPDFNLGLEAVLRGRGIPTVQYVCPSVWAWRPRRVATLRKAVDRVLSILPFEEELLSRHGVRAVFVGHPLADELSPELDPRPARRHLGIDPEQPTIALLPGSRVGEVARLAPVFLETAKWCWEREPQLRFVVPLINRRVRRIFERALDAFPPELPVRLVDGASVEVMRAADLVLAASGTATLEAMCLGRPMVVGYRLHPLTYAVLRGLRLVKTPFASLPNLIAGEELVPELIQSECTPEAMGWKLLDLYEAPQKLAMLKTRFAELHGRLRRDASQRAAEAVLDLAVAR